MRRITVWFSGILALLALALPSSAETFRFTLKDGAVVVGALRGTDGGTYVVATDAGDQKIAADQVRGMERVAIDPSQAAMAPVSPSGLAPYPEFTIMTGDNRLIVGRLLSFDDGVYNVETRSGNESVGVQQVDRIEVAWVLAPRSAGPASSSPTLGEGTLLLSGENGMAEGLAPTLIEAFAADSGAKDMVWSRGTRATLRSFSATAKHGGKFNAEVRLRTSAAAVDSLLRGEAEIGMMARRMTPEEAQRITVAGLGDPLSPQQEHIVAPGGVVVLVHPANPVKSLTLPQLADVFSGKIRNWSEVGGAPRRIQVYVPPPGSGILDVFERRVLGTAPLIPTARTIVSSTEMAELMAGDTTAIGLAEFAHVGNATPLGITDECGITHTPSAFGLSTGEYPLATKLYFYTPATISPTTRDFLRFALSRTGQQRLNQSSVVSLMPSIGERNPVPTLASTGANPWPVDAQLQADLVQLAKSANRLSVVFRFGVAASALDAAAQEDLARLAEFLKTSKGQRRLALVGFSDLAGSPEANVALSEKRARFIEQQLRLKGIEANLVIGFGSALPVACGTSPEADSRNRRVEAWLY